MGVSPEIHFRRQLQPKQGTPATGSSGNGAASDSTDIGIP